MLCIEIMLLLYLLLGSKTFLDIYMHGIAPKEQLETPFACCYKADAPTEQMQV